MDSITVRMLSTVSMVSRSVAAMSTSPDDTANGLIASPSAMKWRFLDGALTGLTAISANLGWSAVGMRHSGCCESHAHQPSASGSLDPGSCQSAIGQWAANLTKFDGRANVRHGIAQVNRETHLIDSHTAVLSRLMPTPLPSAISLPMMGYALTG